MRAFSGIEGEVERSPVVDRRADERQAERHVDAAAERRRLERGQPLVVIHGDDRVVSARDVGDEDRVRRDGPRDVDTGGPRRVDGGRDDLDLLPAEMSALAGVRVEPAHGDARRGDREVAGERCRDDRDGLRDRFARDRRGDRGKRQVSGDERDAQAAADEQHDHARRVRARGEKFGVAGKRVAGVLEHALLHRRGDERRHRPRRAARPRRVRAS